MHRLFGLVMGLFFSLVAAGGYLAFDYWNVNRMSRMGDGDGVSVGEYLGGWLSLAQSASASEAGGPVMPTELAAMLPKPPEGWTLRPTDPADIDAYMQAGADEKLARYVRAVVNPRGGNGVHEARQTYENGPRKVVFELVRYPNFIFTSFGAAALKMELQMTHAKYSGRDFMTVRGMEFTEDLLPEEVGLRYFFGTVADQFWVRVLAPRTMTDEELLPFFETLHVPAMNADVVEKVAGMGEVPVIVLASALQEETRAARDAERNDEAAMKERQYAEKRAQAEAEKAAQQEAARAEEAAREQEAADRANGIETDLETGIKVRKGTGDGKNAAEKPKAGFGADNCTKVGTRKVCGGAGDGG